VVRAPTSEQRLVTRARIVLRSAQGAAIEHVARELGVAYMTVKLWRRRYAEAGLAGLADRPRTGHPPTYTREDHDRFIALTLGPPPDEKTQIQALDRTHPLLPLRPGQVERHTHDYTRHGTTCLFAALEVSSGQVTTDHRSRHTGADFLAFMKPVTRAYPEGELNVVLDNVSTHRTRAVKAWLARNPRIAFHFTPTSASWMNQVETRFGILTRWAIRRGSFGSVKELIAMIDAFTRQWNAGASPFVWVKTADQILAKAVRKPPANNESGR
jgi:transposase